MPGNKSAGGLNKRQRAFVQAYLGEARYNATEAARIAGYSQNSAATIGWENLRKPEIKEAIDRAVVERAMGWPELLIRLGNQARFNLGDYVRLPAAWRSGDSPYEAGEGKEAGPVVEIDPKLPHTWQPYIDIEAMIRDGHGHLIKGITPTQWGAKIEFQDPMAAQKMIAQLLEKAGTPTGGADDPIHHVDMSLDEWMAQQARHRQQAAAAVADFADDDDENEGGAGEGDE